MPTAIDIGTLITRSPEIRGGRLVIAGIGTSVQRIAVLYKQGANPEEIARRMQHLTLAQVYAALAYYHANRDQIESALAEEEVEYWRLAASHGRKANSQVQR